MEVEVRRSCSLCLVRAQLGDAGLCLFQKNLHGCALLETLPFIPGSYRTCRGLWFVHSHREPWCHFSSCYRSADLPGFLWLDSGYQA